MFLALILRFIERRARLFVYYGHVGNFQIQPTAQNPAFDIFTHSVVIRNGGKLAAHNVRVPHARLPGAILNVSVSPGINFTKSLPSGSDEILFPILVAGQQATISYLYYPPLTWNLINLPITCDEGVARVLNVLPTRQLRTWQLWLLWALMIVGAITVLFFLVHLAQWAAAKI